MILRAKFLWFFLAIFSFSKKIFSNDIMSLRPIAYSPAWLKALHYEEHSLSRYASRIDDARFFLGDEGLRDPLTELMAFVNGIKRGQRKFDKPLKCLMPFRYRIALQYQLIDPDPTECEQLAFFKREMGNDGVAIIFVAQYADNPSSIMGHLLLRFSNNRKQLGGKPLVYLSKTINYAAAIPPDTGVIKYVSYGIFGGFTGTYSIYEYADMVEMYNNLESRDIFAYNLQLSQHENEAMTEHIWELLQLASHDYYFFDENCAFQILAILEAVRPHSNLVEKLPFYTTPLDVLKIVANAGLLDSVDYTPSIYQRILDRQQSMTANDLAQFDNILSGNIATGALLSPLVADALIESLTFRKNEQFGKLTAADTALHQGILLRRSRLGLATPSYRKTIKTSPHLSHGDTRLSVGSGAKSGRGFVRFHFRPAVHDLLSRHDGFQRNTSLSLLAIDIRKYSDSQKPLVERIELASLAKLNGTRVQHRLAWDFNFALQRTKPNCRFCLSPDFNVHLGTSQNFVIDTFDAFLLAKFAYRPMVYDKAWSGGLGASIGFSYTPQQRMRFLSFVSRAYNFRNIALDKINFGSGFDLKEDIDLRLTANYLHLQNGPEWHEYVMEAGYSF